MTDVFLMIVLLCKTPWEQTGDRSSHWPGRSKEPCYELPLEGASWQGTVGAFCPYSPESQNAQSYNCKEMNSANNPNEVGSRFIPSPASIIQAGLSFDYRLES